MNFIIERHVMGKHGINKILSSACSFKPNTPGMLGQNSETESF